MRLGRAKINLPLRAQVRLVAHQQLVNALACIPGRTVFAAHAACTYTCGTHAPVNFMEPLFYIVVGLGLRHVIHNDNPMRAAVVAAGDGAEALLPSCVPRRAHNGAR